MNLIARNSLTSVLHVVISGLGFALLSRYLLQNLGASVLGIWSLVLSSASLSKITELGFGGSTTRFVAKYLAESDSNSAHNCIQTALVTLLIFVSVGLAIAYPILQELISFALLKDERKIALELLPFSLTGIWFMSIASIFLAGLEGYQRIDLRNYVLIGAHFFYLACAFILIPNHGVMGLAYAYVSQTALVIVIGMVLLMRHAPLRTILPTRWSKRYFLEMIGYGANYQFVNLSGFVLEPMTKSLLGKYGGSAFLGYYELSSRLILQFRQILTYANRVIVPYVAGFGEELGSQLQELYKKNYTLIFYLSAPLYCGLAFLSPFIGDLWLGEHPADFVFNSFVLALMVFINTQANPAYFSNLGTGKVRPNTIGHLIILALVLLLGAPLGEILHGPGVVYVLAAATISGSLFIILAHHKFKILGVLSMHSMKDIVIILALLASGYFCFLGYRDYLLDWDFKYRGLLFSAIYATLSTAIMSLHPLSRVLVSYSLRKLRSQSAS